MKKKLPLTPLKNIVAINNKIITITMLSLLVLSSELSNLSLSFTISTTYVTVYIAIILSNFSPAVNKKYFKNNNLRIIHRLFWENFENLFNSVFVKIGLNPLKNVFWR